MCEIVNTCTNKVSQWHKMFNDLFSLDDTVRKKGGKKISIHFWHSLGSAKSRRISGLQSLMWRCQSSEAEGAHYRTGQGQLRWQWVSLFHKHYRFLYLKVYVFWFCFCSDQSITEAPFFCSRWVVDLEEKCGTDRWICDNDNVLILEKSELRYIYLRQVYL